MTRIAITNALGHVVTFVRADVPPGWQPPAGCKAVPESALPVGYKVAPPDPTPVPASITAVQARQWLICKGLIAGVDAAIERIQTPVDREMVRAWWEYETDLRRDSSQVARWATACGFTAEQVDAFFREAAEIVP